VVVAEKGSHWCTLRVSGTPGHASQPFRTDNALVTAAEVVRRLAGYHPQTDIHETWRRYVEGMGFSAERSQALLDPEGLEAYCATLPIGLGRNAHACTHTTIAPTMVQGGVKTNVIPDRVDLQVDIRTLPARPQPTSTRSWPTPSATWRRRSPSSRPTTTGAPRRRSTRRCGTPCSGCARASTRGARSCRP
jgi:acetylornithine deacetylase/succinyl-diaminopimelate desuccinylase-like protein